jgi:spore coat protein SA
MPDHLRGLARSLDVDLQLLLGVDDERLAALYRSAAVFLFGARAEPFGLVLLEAMASGLPVVAVEEGGVGEIIIHGKTGFLAPREAGVFAASVETLLDSPSLRSRMGKVARAEILDRWTWDHAAAHLEKHLLRAAEANPEPAGSPELPVAPSRDRMKRVIPCR